jgi:hypothetical protein
MVGEAGQGHRDEAHGYDASSDCVQLSVNVRDEESGASRLGKWRRLQSLEDCRPNCLCSMYMQAMTVQLRGKGTFLRHVGAGIVTIRSDGGLDVGRTIQELSLSHLRRMI